MVSLLTVEMIYTFARCKFDSRKRTASSQGLDEID